LGNRIRHGPRLPGAGFACHGEGAERGRRALLLGLLLDRRPQPLSPGARRAGDQLPDALSLRARGEIDHVSHCRQPRLRRAAAPGPHEPFRLRQDAGAARPPELPLRSLVSPVSVARAVPSKGKAAADSLKHPADRFRPDGRPTKRLSRARMFLVLAGAALLALGRPPVHQALLQFLYPSPGWPKRAAVLEMVFTVYGLLFLALAGASLLASAKGQGLAARLRADRKTPASSTRAEQRSREPILWLALALAIGAASSAGFLAQPMRFDESLAYLNFSLAPG